jgi:hypothetical protein
MSLSAVIVAASRLFGSSLSLSGEEEDDGWIAVSIAGVVVGGGERPYSSLYISLRSSTIVLSLGRNEASSSSSSSRFLLEFFFRTVIDVVLEWDGWCGGHR